MPVTTDSATFDMMYMEYQRTGFDLIAVLRNAQEYFTCIYYLFYFVTSQKRKKTANQQYTSQHVYYVLASSQSILYINMVPVPQINQIINAHTEYLYQDNKIVENITQLVHSGT